MDLGSIGENIILVVVIVAFLIIFSLFRGRNPQKERTDIVQTLLEETRLNIILVDTFNEQPRQWAFHVTGWQLRRKKIGFLDPELRKDIDTSFGMTLDFNQRLKAAKKAKSTKRVTVDTEVLKTTLPRVKQGLEDWLLANTGTIDRPTKKPGMTDFLFGGR